MKVSELIDILNQYEPDASVFIDRQPNAGTPYFDPLKPDDISVSSFKHKDAPGYELVPAGVVFAPSAIFPDPDDPESRQDLPPLSFPVLDYGTDGQPCKVRVLRGDVELGHLVRHQIKGCPDVWASDAQFFFEGGSTFASYCLGDIKDKVRDALRNDHAND